MTIGARLREERLRLGFSQPAFAALARVTKGALVKWEKDTASPNAQALVSFAKAGADLLYILTAKRLPYPADLDEQNTSVDLNDIERELIDPSRARLANETDEETEARVLKEARRLLDGMLGPLSRVALPSEYIERAEALLQATNDPQRLALLRAEDFNQSRVRREGEMELLEMWMASSPYQADYPVLDRMARIALEYSVPHRVLAELHYEICHDLEEQHSAERTIAIHEASERDKSNVSPTKGGTD